MITKRRSIAALATAGAIGLAAYIIPVFEGREHKAYPDLGGVWTICDGDTENVKPGQVASDAECDERTRKQVARAFKAIDRYTDRELKDHEKAALASFIYNVGEGAFARSTLLKKLNAGQPFCNELLRWVNVKGRVVNGLMKRRTFERNLCLGYPFDETFSPNHRPRKPLS